MHVMVNTTDNVFERLSRFIKGFYEGYYKRPLLIELGNETEIENDLGITGDDADDFLAAFVKKFDLDYSQFDGRKYFGYEHEGFDFIFPVARFIFGNRKWLPLPKNKRKKLTLGMLEEAIVAKKLI